MHQTTNDNQAEVNVDDSSSLVERKRERRKDPDYIERKRERNRERNRERHKNRADNMGYKIYVNTYNKIKRQTSNKEEAKKQAKIAREQYIQSVNLAKSSGELPLTSNLVGTTPV